MTSGKSCAGSITPCEALSTDTCTTQPGCSVSSGNAIDAGCDAGANGACNCLSLSGPTVTVTGGGTGAPPPSTGGPFNPGTYVLTSAQYYPFNAGTPLTTAQATIEISASSFDEISSSANMASSTLSGTWSTSGTSVDIFVSCPGGGDLSWTYSATGTTIRFTVPATTGGEGGAPGTGERATETFELQ